jgi:hypothetical protein
VNRMIRQIGPKDLEDGGSCLMRSFVICTRRQAWPPYLDVKIKGVAERERDLIYSTHGRGRIVASDIFTAVPSSGITQFVPRRRHIKSPLHSSAS